MFTKILIANRGEIACRIIRTCHRLRVRTVAIYSDADVNALHVRQADEAYWVGAPPPSESYLNIPRILEIARQSGAEAIHPGYGFLSENAAFVQACQEAGIAFIGPSAEVMQRMGDKVLARRLAAEAGLPTVPGTEADVSDNDVVVHATRIGYPLLIKAAEGGGGIGIQLVAAPDALMEAMSRARSLAQNAFSSSRVYLEKLIKPAAHVEVQIMADHHGNVLHLEERDCSMQRRNQKVIEESPSPRLGWRTRRRLWKAAVDFARHVGYTNAGTVEFLVDQREHFYFLEMNTRIQVEHPVTEMVTKLDLIEMQLRIASGERLRLQQSKIKTKGHAIEVRLYPEDPATLMPGVGVITALEVPTGKGLRLDSALFEGYEVLPYYEPMLGKLIVWRAHRGEAIRRLDEALGQLKIQGVPTNISVLSAALNSSQFRSGNHTTDLFPQFAAQLGEQTTSRDGKLKEVVAAISAAITVLVEQEQQGAANRLLPSDTNAWRQAGRGEQIRSNDRRGGSAW